MVRCITDKGKGLHDIHNDEYRPALTRQQSTQTLRSTSSTSSSPTPPSMSNCPNPMLVLWLLSIAWLPARSQDHPRALPLSLHRGLHFQKLSKVMATSAAPVRFTKKLDPADSGEPERLLLKLKGVLLDLAPVRANVTDSVIEELNTKQKLFTSHFSNAKLDAKLRERRRRNSDNPMYGVSSFLGWCCGFSTYEDVDLLLERDEEVAASLQDLQGVVLDVHSAVTNNAVAAQAVAAQLSAGIHYTVEGLKQLQDSLAYVALLVTAIGTLSTEKMMNAHKMDSIHAACSQRRVPLAAVPQEDMQYAVDMVNKEFQGQGWRVAVRTDTLYKLDIAKCNISGQHLEQLEVHAKLPLTDLWGGNWEAFDVMPLSFLYQGQVCRMLPHSIMAVISEKGTVRLMSPQQRAQCLTREICEVPRSTTVAVDAGHVSTDCVRGIFRKAEPEELQRVCSFTCTPFSRVIISHIENNVYSVVSPDRSLMVMCPNRSSEVLAVSVGAVLVEVACECMLMDQDTVLVAPVQPCDPRLNSAEDARLEVQVPALWATSNFQQLHAYNLRPTTASINRLLDHNWTQQVATFTLPQPAKGIVSPVLSAHPRQQGLQGQHGGWLPTPPVWLTVSWLAILSALLVLLQRRLSHISSRLGL